MDSKAGVAPKPNGGVGKPRRVSLLFGSRRIAVRIFIGYLLPLLIFLIAGLVLPFVFTSLLGQATRDYAQTARFVDNAYAMRRAARDCENDLRGYLRYNDREYRQQFATARGEYRERFRQMQDFFAVQNNASLSGNLVLADSAFRRWYTNHATAEFAAADRARLYNIVVATAAANRSERGFASVETALDRLVQSSEQYSRQQLQRANVSERLRVVFTWVVPLVAMLIAVLFARFFTVGITQPIEALRLAAEEVEQGDNTRLLLDEYPHEDDEIGDLAHALSRMAQTIGEREAILRAQNEALSAIGRRIEAVLNATNDGIVLLDRAEGFSLVNERFASLFGLDAEVVRDQTFADAAPLFLDRFKHKTAAASQFKEWVANFETVADETMDVTEPTPRTLRIYTAPVRGETGGASPATGGIIGRIFVFRDVTRETIVDRMKTEFVSTVSHELRTPLTAIKGYVDLMIAGKTGEMNPVQTEFLGMVQESTRRLTGLINDMLDISRIESGRISVRKETVELLSVARDAARMMAGQAEARGVSLTVTPPPLGDPLPTVRGDRDRITQVLMNLLSNAVKYTPSGGSVTISIEEENGVVTTCIADTGVGISADDQNHLFQKFFRADNSTTRAVGGTGLGLAITRAILERMAGTIRVESETGSGSRFLFTLPAASVPDAAPPRTAAAVETVVTTPTAPAPATRALILLVADEPAVLHRMTGLFRGSGYVTSGAMTPAEAVRRARDLRPDAVLVNLAATRFNIFALLHALRTGADTRRVPLFLCVLRPASGDIEPQCNVVVTSPGAPPLGDAVSLGDGDTEQTLIQRIHESQTALGDPVHLQIRLADFAPGSDRHEPLALALQQRLIDGTPMVLHVRDSDAGGAGGVLASLASPDAAHCSPEAITSAVGNYLRAATVPPP